MAYIALFFIALGVTTCMNLMFWPLTRQMWREKRWLFKAINIVCLLGCVSFLVMFHHQARAKIAPVEQEFLEFVATARPTYQVLANGEQKVLVYSRTDRQRLEAILRKRDRLLAEKGFIMIGEWRISGLVWGQPGTPDIWSASYLPTGH